MMFGWAELVLGVASAALLILLPLSLAGLLGARHLVRGDVERERQVRSFRIAMRSILIASLIMVTGFFACAVAYKMSGATIGALTRDEYVALGIRGVLVAGGALLLTWLRVRRRTAAPRESAGSETVTHTA